MQIYVFGNSEVEDDALPLRIMPELQHRFPQFSFVSIDPNEEWDVPETLVAIDAVMGIKDVMVFAGLDAFDAAPRVTAHDFDALANMKLLGKLGKLKNVTIIGVPQGIPEKEALEKVSAALEGLHIGQ